MLVQRILNTSFFEWCILWLIAFVSGISVFIITDRGTQIWHNHKLPQWRSTLVQSRLYNHTKDSIHNERKCNTYTLATYNKLSLQEAIARLACKDKVIILSYVDMGFIDMAENFIETSLVKHNLTNVLFFSSSARTCEFLEHKLCRSCYITQPNGQSEQQSVFGSLEFISKMNIRTNMIYSVLQEGYNVVHTDNDVVFLQDPMDDLKERCETGCDLAPLWDRQSHNAGFLFIRATDNSQKLYSRMIEMADAFPNIDDQRILNAAMQEMSTAATTETLDDYAQLEEEEYVDPEKLQNMDVLLQGSEQVLDIPEYSALKVVSLPRDLYLSGAEYFVQGHRYFAGDNPCGKCLVVHNNWLVEKSSKIWRFKENHLWMVDSHGYYTNPNARFLTIDNQVQTVDDDAAVSVEDVEDDEEFDDRQKTLLENGFRLAKCLNRTLILPKMFINRFSPPTPAWYAHEKFLNELIQKYDIEVRESTFFRHPKVEMKFQSAVSVPIKISMTELTEKELKSLKEQKLLQYRPRNVLLGPRKLELENWFSDFGEVTVLRFDSVWVALKLLDQCFDTKAYLDV